MVCKSRFSPKRAALLSLLRSGRLDHPTAMEIYSAMRQTYPNISMGTVYRNLKFLSRQGEILVVGAPDESERFDHNTFAHSHFFCKKCGRIVDIPIPEKFVETAEASSGVKIQSLRVVAEGVCNRCGK